MGDIAVIYCSGLGPVTPTVTAGDPIPPNVHPQLPLGTNLTVTIGGVAAPDIKYAGLSGYVGLYQVNVTVPNGVQAGDTVPVFIKLGNLPSQPGVTMAVKAQAQ